MKLDNENFELIERYLNNELSGAELYDFEKRVKEDNSFAEEVDFHKMANEIVIDQGLLDIKQKIKSYNYKQKSASNSKYFISAGIAVILSISVFVFNKNDKPVLSTPEEITQNETPREAAVESEPQETPEEQKLDLPKKPTSTLPQIPLETKEIIEPGIDSASTKDLIEEIMPREKQAYYAPLSNKPVLREISSQKQKEEVCLLTDVTAKFSIIGTCSSSSSGKIVIENVMSEGVGPFEYSINEGTFKSSNEFKNLSGGIYYVTVKDARGCIGRVDEQIFIQEKECLSNEFSFSPLLGEVWKFPTNKNTFGKILIFNRNGGLVYSSSINNGSPSSWDGTTNSGQDLPLGIYTFMLKMDKKTIEGTVTIIK